MLKTIRIRMSLGLSGATPGAIQSRGEAILKGMTGNTAYPNPPVDLAALNTALVSLSALTAAALDGGKNAVAAMQQQRETVLKMLRLLGHYVEATCNNDMVVFNSSGFLAAASTRVPPQPLPPAKISKIDHGNSGQLLVSIVPLPKAKSYEIRYSSVAGTWTTQAAPSARPATPINGLTPGTTYTFQVRALGRLGFTDWSDSVTRMSV